MKFHILDIQKNSDGLQFQEVLDLKEELKSRSPEVLDLSPVQVTGSLRYEANLYFLDYQLQYEITLASSRSMAPVLRSETLPVQEIFVASESHAQDQDLIDADLVLVVENDEISLEESAADNILMNIPLKVLTPEEEAANDYPQGNDWAVLSEEDYEKAAQEKKEANSPFAGLSGLFADDE